MFPRFVRNWSSCIFTNIFRFVFHRYFVNWFHEKLRFLAPATRAALFNFREFWISEGGSNYGLDINKCTVYGGLCEHPQQLQYCHGTCLKWSKLMWLIVVLNYVRNWVLIWIFPPREFSAENRFKKFEANKTNNFLPYQMK